MTDSQKPCTIYSVMSDLPTSELVYQVQAFRSYSSRGGRLSIEEWMDTKDFAPRERSAIRSIWKRSQ